MTGFCYIDAPFLSVKAVVLPKQHLNLDRGWVLVRGALQRKN